MNFNKRIIWIMPMILILFGCPPPQLSVFEQYTPQSDLVFSGTILLTGTSTIDADDVSDLAIVEVDEIFKGQENFKSFKGRKITIKLKDPKSSVEGNKYIFFTKGWIFGESIGVVEIGNKPVAPSTNLKEVQTEVNKVEQTEDDKQLVKRLSAAELVVSGKIINITRFKVEEEATEHSPEWQKAEIKVDKVIKGTSTSETVSILFAGSNDVMWYDSPKFKKDEEGIWLLKSYEFAGRKLEFRVVVDKKDFYLKYDEPRIIRVLKK